MKVGILTFHHTTNYGATLQAYALWTTLTNQGYDVELIDYRPLGAVKYYLKQNLNRHLLANLVKSWKMRSFLLSNMRLNKKTFYTRADLKSFSHPYDVVICGSDQIWCIDTPFRGFDPSYFLDFINHQTPCRKISYAASFGSTDNLGKHKEAISNLVGQFDAISVRDSNSLRLIQQECNKSATRVLDPTFLGDYSKILSLPKLREKYLLIYHDRAPMTSEEENFLRSLAKTQQLTIISVGKYNKIARKNFIDVSPEQWLGYFSKASYVFTNTYHGTIFSLIFKKPFTVLQDSGKSNKLKDLLNKLDLESRILVDPNSVESLSEESLTIDYDSVYEKIEKEVMKSKSYLFEAISDGQLQSSALKI